MRGLYRGEDGFVVGRQVERRWLAGWLAGDAPLVRIVAVQGPSGVGKTTLLAQLARDARRAGQTAWLVDGRYTNTPRAFVDYLTFLAEGAAVPSVTAQTPLDGAALHALFANRRSLLLIDNAEDLALTGEWLRTAFLPGLRSARLLVMLASRRQGWWEWTTDPLWLDRFDTWHLSSFTVGEVQEYLTRRGVDGDRWSYPLYRQSGGHPLSLAMAADVVRSEPHRLPEVFQAVTARLIREVVAESWAEWLDILAVVQEADLPTLSELAGHPLDALTYHRLAALSFVSVGPLGLRLHDAVRKVWLSDLCQRDPDHFRQLRRTAIEVLGRRREGADEATRRRTSALFLDLYREQVPAYPWFDWRAVDEQSGGTGLRPGDLPALHALVPATPHIEFLAPEHHHPLLEAMAERAPGSIRVVRSADGRPIGFWAALWLARSTMPLVHRYLPGWVRAWPDDWQRYETLPETEADTCLTVFFCFRAAPPRYRAEDVAGLVLFDALVGVGGGVRIWLSSTDPVFKATVSQLGLARRLIRDPETGREAEILEADKRGQGFLALARFLERRAHASLVQRLDPATLEALLRAWHQPRRLSRLARSHGLHWAPVTIQQRLKQLLEQDPPPAPLTRDTQAVLRSTFLHVGSSVDAVALTLHMSRTTYYRHRRAGLQQLAEAWTELAHRLPETSARNASSPR